MKEKKKNNYYKHDNTIVEVKETTDSNRNKKNEQIICVFRSLLSKVMSLVSQNCVISCLITSPEYFLGLLSPFVKLFKADLRAGTLVHLLFTCPNRLNRLSYNHFNSLCSYLKCQRMLILSFLVWHENSASVAWICVSI